MKQLIAALLLSLRLWLFTALFAGLLLMLALVLFLPPDDKVFWVLLVLPATFIAALPAMCCMLIALVILAYLRVRSRDKYSYLLLACALVCLPYGLIGAAVFSDIVKGTEGFVIASLITSSILFGCCMLAVWISSHRIANFFSPQATPERALYISKTTNYMEPVHQTPPAPEGNNKHLLKALITGVLILVMLIPTLFVSNLITEREQRQQEIVNEVSSKWSAAQQISGPYITVPYSLRYKDGDGRMKSVVRHLALLPENLSVKGSITPVEAHRSIYDVLLYTTTLTANGAFRLKLPDDIDTADVDFSKARICVGLSDFKGIEEKVQITLGDASYTLTAGLPNNIVNNKGLSAPIQLDAGQLDQPLAFATNLKLKGSKELSFLPLSANSEYELQSTWPSPSFNGATLPSERTVSDSGFRALWKFNEANLPYTTAIHEGDMKDAAVSFGVNMLQPADHYAKTTRSVKYAILVIGLTFALFFIIELMQKKPVHPLQYTLVGLALVIFYTLLLSISEFIDFDLAYLIAAAATVLLISAYANSLFRKLSTALVFGGVLTALYSFIFVLIRLEDTALLVGSIGLFLILALVMYASRKVNWYGTTLTPNSA